MWSLSNIDLKYIVKSWPFISIVLVGLVLMVVGLSEIGNIFGTATLPVTWKMLNIGGVFSISINICTFLYAGMLVSRAKITRVNHLVDATPIPNWTLLFSKVIALVKMQIILLAVIMLAGIIFQVYNGYYNFEFGHYFKELFILSLLGYLVWAFLSVFIQTLVGNPYLGLFILLVVSIGIPFLSFAGIELNIYKYNQGPGFGYSDMNDYGILSPFLIYKTYWILCGLSLLVMSALFWVRGIPASFSERLSIAKSRLKGGYAISLTVFLIAFFSLGIFDLSRNWS
jgi:ABC-2 type transport system permease protein